MTPLISIITCCYNSQETIGDTFNSIRTQTFKDFELIVIDGNSSDNTLDIIKQNADLVTKLISEKDNGVYDAMNKGIELAKGKVIGFLNSDDFFFNQNVLNEIAQAFLKADIDCSYANMIYVDRYDTSKIKREWKSGRFYKNYLKDGWIPGHPTFYVRKEIYARLGKFNLKMKLAADYELMLRILSYPGIKVMYLPKTHVVMRLGGITSKNLKNRIKQNIEIYQAWLKNDMKPGILFFLRRLFIKIKQIQ